MSTYQEISGQYHISGYQHFDIVEDYSSIGIARREKDELNYGRAYPTYEEYLSSCLRHFKLIENPINSESIESEELKRIAL